EQVTVSDFCSTGIDDSVVHRKVLLEDYTGHLCGNCPDAEVYLNDSLKPIFNHCLVVVSVHADYFATVCPNGAACPGNQPPGAFTTDFNTTAGTDWFNSFDVVGNPRGLVNRIGFPNLTHIKPPEAWAGLIADQLSKKADAKISLQNSYNPITRVVDVNVKTNFLNNLTGIYKLQVIITEDSIFDLQQWDPPHTPLYVSGFNHRHVLRDALNSSWGETIASGTISTGDAVTKIYSYSINSNWNADHCSMVAFVYNDDTKEVVQVEERPVK